MRRPPQTLASKCAAPTSPIGARPRHAERVSRRGRPAYQRARLAHGGGGFRAIVATAPGRIPIPVAVRRPGFRRRPYQARRPGVDGAKAASLRRRAAGMSHRGRESASIAIQAFDSGQSARSFFPPLVPRVPPALFRSADRRAPGVRRALTASEAC